MAVFASRPRLPFPPAPTSLAASQSAAAHADPLPQKRAGRVHGLFRRPVMLALQWSLAGLVLLAPAAVIQAQTAGAAAEINQLLQSGNKTQARALLDKSLAADSRNPQLRFLQGLMFSESGDAPRAIDVFTQLTRDYPDMAEPYNNLAVLYADQGLDEKALVALSKAIAINPNYATAYENMGDLHTRLANEAYRRAMKTGADGVQPKLALLSQSVNTGTAPPVAAAGAAATPITPAAASPAKPVSETQGVAGVVATRPAVAAAGPIERPATAAATPAPSAVAAARPPATRQPADQLPVMAMPVMPDVAASPAEPATPAAAAEAPAVQIASATPRTAWDLPTASDYPATLAPAPGSTAAATRRSVWDDVAIGPAQNAEPRPADAGAAPATATAVTSDAAQATAQTLPPLAEAAALPPVAVTASALAQQPVAPTAPPVVEPAVALAPAAADTPAVSHAAGTPAGVATADAVNAWTTPTARPRASHVLIRRNADVAEAPAAVAVVAAAPAAAAQTVAAESIPVPAVVPAPPVTEPAPAARVETPQPQTVDQQAPASEPATVVASDASSTRNVSVVTEPVAPATDTAQAAPAEPAEPIVVSAAPSTAKTPETIDTANTVAAAASVSAEPAVAVTATETTTQAAASPVAPEAATTAPMAAARAAAEPSAATPVAAAVPSASPAAAVVPSTPAPNAAVPPVEPKPSPVVVASVAPDTAAPAATVAQPAVVADEAGARAAVNAWLAAWNNRNADEFVAAYSAGFKPEDGTDHAAWVQSVRAGLDVPRPRVLQISGLSFELPTASSADGAPMAIARFRESSVAGVLRITKLKRLDLRHDGQRWVIVEEGSGL